MPIPIKFGTRKETHEEGEGDDKKEIKETVDDIKVLVKEQNGRVRSLESSVSSIQSVGSFVALVFGSLIGWLYKGDS